MTPGVPAKLIASTMGLGAFGIAIIAGLAVDNPADRILSRAIISMFLCNAVGLTIGLIAEKAVVTCIGTYMRARPVHEHVLEVDEAPEEPATAGRIGHSASGRAAA